MSSSAAAHTASASASASFAHTPLASPTATVPRHLPYPFLLSPSVSQRRLVSQSDSKRHSSHSKQHRSSTDSSGTRQQQQQQQYDGSDGSDTGDEAAVDYLSDSDVAPSSDGASERSRRKSPRVGLPGSSPAASTARSFSADMADKQHQSFTAPDAASSAQLPMHEPLSLPHAYKLLAAAAEGSKSSLNSPASSFSPHAQLLPHSRDEDGSLVSSLASLLSVTDPLSVIAPLYSSFASPSPAPAIHTSFINTLLLSDRSCLLLCLLNFAIWFVCVLVLRLLVPYLPGGYYPSTYHSGFWHGFHVWCCLAATLLLFVLFSTPSSKKQRISAIALCILLVCVFTYLVLALQLLPVYTDMFGHELYPLRYVEWACTTPLMLLLVCNLDVQPRGLVLWIVAVDVGMIVTGALAALSPNYSVMAIWLVVSFMCELDTLSHMHTLFVQYRQLVGAYPRILLTINFLGQ